jgi:catechol 2,3-dioxygenase-like lactoylglutathione lyase family enzyme
MTPQLLGTPVAFILATDRARALAFYGETLGLPLRSSDDFGDFIDMGGGLLRLTVIPGHVASPHPVLGWTVEDIVASVQALAARGVVFTIYEGMGQDALGIWTAPDSTARVAFFADPDGNVLSLSQG